MSDRLSRQPYPGICRPLGYPAHYRASGAYRPAYGGRHVTAVLGQEGWCLRYAAWSRFRECLWRRGSGFWRGRANPGPAHGLCPADRPHPPELQFDRGHVPRGQDYGTGNLRR